MVLWGALAIWVSAFVEPRKATLHPGPLQGLRSRESRSAPCMSGGPAPAPLRTQAEHRVAHHPALHPFAGQLRKDLPGSGGLSIALTYLGVPLPRTLRCAHASLVSLPPPSSPSPASRAGFRSPQRRKSQLGAARRLLYGPGSGRRREVTAPPSDGERGRRGGSGALTPSPALIYPRQPKISRAPAANPRNAPSGAKRHFPACCSLGGDGEASWKERGPPALLPTPGPGGAGWGPPEQLCTPPPALRPVASGNPSLTLAGGLGWNLAFRGGNEIITDLADVHAQPQSPRRVVSSTSTIA